MYGSRRRVLMAGRHGNRQPEHEAQGAHLQSQTRSRAWTRRGTRLDQLITCRQFCASSSKAALPSQQDSPLGTRWGHEPVESILIQTNTPSLELIPQLKFHSHLAPACSPVTTTLLGFFEFAWIWYLKQSFYCLHMFCIFTVLLWINIWVPYIWCLFWIKTVISTGLQTLLQASTFIIFGVCI